MHVEHRVIWGMYRPYALIFDVTHVDLDEHWLVAVNVFSIGGEPDTAGVRPHGEHVAGSVLLVIGIGPNVAHSNVPQLPWAEFDDFWPVRSTHVEWVLAWAENPVAKLRRKVFGDPCSKSLRPGLHRASGLSPMLPKPQACRRS